MINWIKKKPNYQCSACGKLQSAWKIEKLIRNDLVHTWEISPEEAEYFDKRESSNCSKCHSSLRSRILARAILSEIDDSKRYDSLKNMVDSSLMKKMKVAEISEAGHLHQFLQKLPLLSHSEYFSDNPSINKQDLMNLTYATESFDFIFHSEVLEHTPDYLVAIAECHRILKTGGKCIFTIPLIWNRSTRKRCVIKNEKIEDLLPPSYHGGGESFNRVFFEFGGDILDLVKNNLKIELKCIDQLGCFCWQK